MRNFLVLLLLLNLTVDVTAQCVDSSQIDVSVMCPTVYDPVCGCNGITYSNSCEAQYYGGVTSWTTGECGSGGNTCFNPSQIDSNVFCPMNYDPVCGCNGVTYSNSCVAFYFGGVTSWTTGECGSGGNTCVNPTQIDSSVICTTNYDPVCGCDSVTYSNSCVAQYYAGVTTWTPGPCQTQIQLADSCTNLTGINFGECDMFLGFGLINGICSPISGCGTIVGNIDYAPALTSTQDSCQNGCMTITDAPECSNLANVDFGGCAMPLGYGIIGGQCQMISGCSTISGTTDYASSLYQNADSCQLCISSGLVVLTNDITVYPTIVNSYIYLEVSDISTHSSFSLFNFLGEEVYSDLIKEKQTLISLELLPTGVYILYVIGDYKQHFRLLKY